MTVLLLLLAACPTPAADARAPTIAERIGDHRFATPIDAPPTLALLDGGEVDTRAETCAGCHPDHGTEWRASTHAAAIHDVQFVAELAKPDQPRWLCLNCHAPTVPQRAERITPDTRLARADSITELRTEPNPAWDPARTEEGVGCATCHVRRDADGKGTVVGPRGSGRAPHRVRVDAAALHDVCVGCHSPGADIVITPTFPCWFSTAEELAAGPDAGADCVSCHMPPATRAAAAGGPELALRRHTWTGGGIPKSSAGFATLEARGWESALDVSAGGSPPTLTLTNARGGHAVPTGDPERHFRLTARALDASGRELATDTLRIGQTWDWGDAAAGRAAHKTGDNRLAPRETRAWTPTLAAPTAQSVEFVVESVRLTEANAAHMAGAELDEELQALWPALATDFAAKVADYPRSREVWRGTVPLAPATPTP